MRRRRIVLIPLLVVLGITVLPRSPRVAALGSHGITSDRRTCTVKKVRGVWKKVCRRTKVTPTAPPPTLFSAPSGIAVDRSDYVYVVDAARGHIVKLDPNGHVQAIFGQRGHLAGQLETPRGIALDDRGNMYVSEVSAFGGNRGAGAGSRIQKLSPQGTPLADFKSPTFGAEIPCGLAVDTSGSVIVGEYVGGRILKLSSTGTEIAHFTTVDPAPCGVALDVSGNIYASQAYTEDVGKYSPDGRRIAVLGPTGKVDPPFGVALDATGNLVMVHVDSASVERLSPGGGVLSNWGGVGSAPGQFRFDEHRMLGFAVDRGGDVYVSDPGNERVQKFASDGRVLATWK